jgi:lipoprotein-anchoring transpeptidase ErfK/SrfK
MSKRIEVVKMHYAMFFTHDGKAIHQYHGPVFSIVRALKTSVSDSFGSHGCVRLQEEDARALFSWASNHTIVHVQ